MNEYRHRTGWLLALALLLTACSDKVPALRPLSSGDHLVAFGDSLTYGTGAAPEQSYPAVLARAIGLPVVNAGVPGERTADGLQRLAGVLDDQQPALLLLTHGGNDFLAGKPTSTVKANLRQMVALARERGVEVVLVGVPQPKLLLSPAALYQELADELDLPYLRDSITDVLKQRGMKSDTIHPNAAGYAQIAREMQDLLQAAGAID